MRGKKFVNSLCCPEVYASAHANCSVIYLEISGKLAGLICITM